jgi:hypothetical protein
VKIFYRASRSSSCICSQKLFVKIFFRPHISEKTKEALLQHNYSESHIDSSGANLVGNVDPSSHLCPSSRKIQS